MSSSLSLLAMSASLHMECNSRMPISVRSIVSRVGDNPAGLLSECRRVQQHQFLALWSGSHDQAIFTLIRPPGRARVGRGAAVMEQGQRRQGRQHQRHHTTPLDSLWDSTGRHPRTRICPRHCNLPEAEARSAVWRGGAWRSVFYSCNNKPSHFAVAGGGDNRRAGRPTSHSASSEHRVNSPDRNTDGLPAESAWRCEA